MRSAEARPEVLVESRQEWHDWLAAHHADSSGIWLVRWKKAASGPHVTYDDVVEEAIAFGWIDSLPRTLDEHRSRLLLTPRKPGSSWSKVNKERVARLEAAGALQPAGRAVVEGAKADGSWVALDQVETLTEPADLVEALAGRPGARRNWDAFPPSTRRAILEWIAAAKTEATRTKRVAQTAVDAGHNLRANQWRQPKGTRSGGST